jgi:type VI secretion system protein ImpK
MSERKRGAAAFIDIDALLQDTWLQVISLRHGPKFQDGEGRTLWERCIADVERVQRELKASELDEASCQHILTAQCALLDEAVKGRGVEDDACVQWYDIPCRGTSSAPWTPAIRCAIGCVMCCVNRLQTTPS